MSAQGTGMGWKGLRTGAVLALALAVAAPAVAADRTASLQPEQIRLVQRALQDRGYRVAPTGRWDAATRNALGSFQSANRLRATGTLDEATSQALGVDPWAVAPVAGSRQPVAGRQPLGRDTGNDPAANCAINDTVDCMPGH